MNEPRFVVASVTGWLDIGSSAKEPGVTFSVLDSGYCYRRVAEYRSEDVQKRLIGGFIPGRGWLSNARARELARGMAESEADRLNRTL
jgi:hypothetical protein